MTRKKKYESVLNEKKGISGMIEKLGNYRVVDLTKKSFPAKWDEDVKYESIIQRAQMTITVILTL